MFGETMSRRTRRLRQRRLWACSGGRLTQRPNASKSRGHHQPDSGSRGRDDYGGRRRRRAIRGGYSNAPGDISMRVKFRDRDHSRSNSGSIL